MKKVVSTYTQVLPYNDEYSIVYHAIFGTPAVVEKSIADLLLMAKESHSRVTLEMFCEGYDKDSIPVIKDVMQELCDARILLNRYRDEKYDIEQLYQKHNEARKNKVKYLSLIMSEDCNFACKYCIHAANANHPCTCSGKMMSLATAKIAIDEYMFSVCDNHLCEAYINFGGGEPLMNWTTIYEVLPYIEKWSKQAKIPIRISLNSNLSLMTEEIAKILIQYNVEIAASLDGSKEYNDAVRITRDSKGTYDRIIGGFEILEKLGRPLNGFAMTVTQDNFDGINHELIDWAASLNMKEVRIDIDVVGMVDIPTEVIADKLFEIRQYAKTKGISVIGFWSRPAENLGLDPEKEDIGFCGGERGNSICVSPNGWIYPCGYSNYVLGTVTDIEKVHERTEYNVLLERRNLGNYDPCNSCVSCPIFGFCRGGCLITHEANQSDDSKMSRMCELYRSMTAKIIRESVDDMALT